MVRLTALRREFDLLFGLAQSQRLRSIRQFAEEEITVPDGPFRGQKFLCRRQPFSRCWFDLIDDPWWTECVITGPSQSGKTLIGFVIPILYHLFEMGQTVIAAVPDYEMVNDKWDQDIEPVLALTRYASLVPRFGKGSKGGRMASIKFGNGAILRFMTAGGSDKSRAGYTAPIVCMTETDGFDTRTSTSEEADKIEQIEARTRAYYPDGRRIQPRIYKECTLTTAEGHTWRRYSGGTASRIMLCCPHCQAWVSPEREDLTGWQQAATDAAAMEAAAFMCPACGEAWSEPQRITANESAALIHVGQNIAEDGEVVGERPHTRTLGFRWSAVNNLLVPAGAVGLDEWRAAREIDEDNAERKLCQFVWAVPYKPRDSEIVALHPDAIRKRVAALGKGVVPDDTRWVTIGVDVNKRVLHWTAIAWRANGTGHVIDYGTKGTGVEDAKVNDQGRLIPDTFPHAIVVALRDLRERIGEGWSSREYHRVHVDARGWSNETLLAIKQLNDRRWVPFYGLGKGHWVKGYTQPRAVNKQIVWIGNACYEQFLTGPVYVRAMYADANYWKTWLHQRLAASFDAERHETSPGGITLYQTMQDGEHLNFAKHLTAERETQIFEQGRGYIKVWEAIRSQNHWLDATYIACVAAHRIGFERPQSQQQPTGAMHVAAPPQGDTAPTFYSGGDDGFTAPTF